MGASIQSILSLLTKDFSKLILIAILIASPLSWYIMNNWLQSFAYKIELSWWIFLVSGLVVIMIALFTVSIHTLKAAASDPVKSLRYE
jgi:putative ABC transport system permease protein